MSNSLTRDRTSGKSHIEQHLRAQLELLQNHDGDASASPGSRDSRGALAHSPSSQGANGYEDLAAVSHEAVRALGKTQVEAHIHPDLRGLSEQSPPDMMSISPAPGHSPSTSPTALSSASMAPAPSSSAADVGAAVEGRKAKRELSQSKRAAQNRAAQVCNFHLASSPQGMIEADLVLNAEGVPSTQRRLHKKIGTTGPRVCRDRPDAEDATE